MILDGQQRKKLQTALIDAFPNQSSLKQMVSFGLDKNLEAIAGGDNLQVIVFNLINVAVSEGWLKDLIYASLQENNGNLKLKKIVDELLSNQQLEALQYIPDINISQSKKYHLDAEAKKKVTADFKLQPSLQKYRFEYAEVVRSSGLFGILKEPTITSRRKEAKYFIEDLGSGVELEMIAIPNGDFLMGSHDQEKNVSSSEFPQHLVSVNSFFIGKYPITQKQWKAVACLPEINCPLVANCSKFKGDNYPVEQVDWDDAMEFCNRLSQKTGHCYQLSSEAEWEYACRAGTDTLFHFGDIITYDLVNCKDYEDLKSSKQPFRNQTGSVDNFNYANAFGLYGMHGLVWEWCMDGWHNNYNKAPNNGMTWVNNRDSLYHVIRGGSWADVSGNCRSASRRKAPNYEKASYLGFRVVCYLN